MDVLSLGKSKTRQKIFKLFLANPGQDFYLQQMKRELSLSAGDLRRELLNLVALGLFERIKTGRLIYYKIHLDNPIMALIKPVAFDQTYGEVLRWASSSKAFDPAPDRYCQTRDVFQARLDSLTSRLQKIIGDQGYLLSAVAGEIGNNSFDHNLGQWPDMAGICFVHSETQKKIILADRGQGILKTIRNVLPKTKNDREALKIAFTQVISGRSPENRGNGLKFVADVIKNKKWSLEFSSGQAVALIGKLGQITIKQSKTFNQGCLAIINYSYEN